MTNPDNVGGLFYPSGDDVDQMIELAIQCGIDNRGTSWPVTLCRLRAKVRAELCRAAPAGPTYLHQWNEDGERCVKCGDKDWMGGPCSKPDAAPAGGDRVDGEMFICYLIDKCERETVSEESLHEWLADFLKNPRYHRPSAPAGSGEVEQQVRWLRVAIDEEKEKPGVYQRPWMIATYEAAIATLLRKQGAAIPPHDAEEYRNIVFNPDERTSAIIRQAQAAGWNKCRAWLIAASQGQEGG